MSGYYRIRARDLPKSLSMIAGAAKIAETASSSNHPTPSSKHQYGTLRLLSPYQGDLIWFVRK